MPWLGDRDEAYPSGRDDRASESILRTHDIDREAEKMLTLRIALRVAILFGSPEPGACLDRELAKAADEAPDKLPRNREDQFVRGWSWQRAGPRSTS